MNYGREYRYPHDFDGNYVPEDYLPEALGGRRYYTPSDNGAEGEIAARLEAWRASRDQTEDGDEPPGEDLGCPVHGPLQWRDLVRDVAHQTQPAVDGRVQQRGRRAREQRERVEHEEDRTPE